MLGRELELRSTEILLGQQVQQVQEQQVQQEHQGHCSISFKNSKCSKNNEIEWSKIKCSKDSVTKCSESSISVDHPVRTIRTRTGQSDDKNKCTTACAFVVAGCFVLWFCNGNGSFSAGKLGWA